MDDLLLLESGYRMQSIFGLYKEFSTLPLRDRQLQDGICSGLLRAYWKEVELQYSLQSAQKYYYKDPYDDWKEDKNL